MREFSGIKATMGYEGTPVSDRAALIRETADTTTLKGDPTAFEDILPKIN